MGENGAVVVVGGTRAIGLELVRHYLDRGDEVWLTGQSKESVTQGLEATGGRAKGAVVDLAVPESIAPAVTGIGSVKHLALVAIDRDQNTVKDYDISRALRLVTLKLIGYTEVVHALLDRLGEDSSVLLFGGMAKDRPYPGSTTVTTVNGGVVGLTRTLVEELKPIRVNSLHPGIVGDSPYWAEKPAAVANYTAQTPTGRLATMADIVHAAAFLLENPAMNGTDLMVDGGWHCR